MRIHWWFLLTCGRVSLSFASLCCWEWEEKKTINREKYKWLMPRDHWWKVRQQAWGAAGLPRRNKITALDGISHQTVERVSRSPLCMGFSSILTLTWRPFGDQKWVVRLCGFLCKLLDLKFSSRFFLGEKSCQKAFKLIKKLSVIYSISSSNFF